MNECLPASVRIGDAFALASARNASDVHMAAGLPPVLRVDGELEKTSQPPLDRRELREVARAIVGDEKLARLETDGDVTGTWTDSNLGRVRVHVYLADGAPAIAMRVLHRRPPSLEALQMPAVVATFAREQHGLVLVGGPTGSGKSTTMAALIDRVNADSARRILTIEDPIEYRHESRRSVLTQREVGRDTQRLSAALFGALRADPDVIVVGEMRDTDAIAAALSAAQTGHLVMSTLHTGSAAQTVERITDAFPDSAKHHIRAQLANALVGIVCQHLVRRSSSAGRRAAVEILIATDAVRALIRDGKPHQLNNAIATGGRYGMQTLAQHLNELLRTNEIERCEAERFGVLDACPEVA